MKFYIVDAFTKGTFRGNPAAVCYLEKILPEEKMQEIANEFNLSETAFVCPNSDNGYNLRWFTPKCEVDLCGHATLATAAALYDMGLNGTYHFSTKSGVLEVGKTKEGFAMNFPSQGNFSSIDQSLKLNGLKIINQVQAHDDILIEVEDSQALKKWQPDIEELSKPNCRGVIVTAKDSTGEYDFISRFFGDKVGVMEDPVTGSAHCKLTPYWSKKLAKRNFRALQASERGGVLGLELKNERIIFSAEAKIFAKGELIYQ